MGIVYPILCRLLQVQSLTQFHKPTVALATLLLATQSWGQGTRVAGAMDIIRKYLSGDSKTWGFILTTSSAHMMHSAKVSFKFVKLTSCNKPPHLLTLFNFQTNTSWIKHQYALPIPLKFAKQFLSCQNSTVWRRMEINATIHIMVNRPLLVMGALATPQHAT